VFIKTNSSTTNLRNHLASVHKDLYVRDFCTGEELSLLASQPARALAVKFGVAKIAACHRALTLWLLKSSKPLSTPRHEHFAAFITLLSSGGYTVPNCHQIDKCILELSAEGSANLVEVMRLLKQQGVMPCVTGDIWSEGGKALLGICMHYISGALPLFLALLQHFVSTLSALCLHCLSVSLLIPTGC
jgi:hypothetical protein